MDFFASHPLVGGAGYFLGILEFPGILVFLGILECPGILEFLNSRCPLNFAVAAVKRRLQDCEAIFYNFGAGLTVGRRSGSVQASFVLICELAATVTKKHKLSG